MAKYKILVPLARLDEVGTAWPVGQIVDEKHLKASGANLEACVTARLIREVKLTKEDIQREVK